MKADNRSFSRRRLVAGALMAPAVFAEKAAAPAGKIWSNEYWAQKGDVKLYMFRKRASAPKAGEKALPVLFLIHGSSNSGRSSFDLATPGKGEYSVMNVFAGLGYDVWTMDHENYGHSSQTHSNSDIASGAQDIKAGVDVIAKETGAQKVHLMGESSGAIRVGRLRDAGAGARGSRGAGGVHLQRRQFADVDGAREGAGVLSHANRRLRDRAMIRSIFTRDKPGTTDPAIAEFLADEELKFGDQVPTGTYLDMTSKLPLVDPKKVLGPVLLVRGEYDGIATMNDLSDFFLQLPNGDRQFVVLPGMAHSVVQGTNRQVFWHAMHSFLSMPKTTLS